MAYIIGGVLSQLAPLVALWFRTIFQFRQVSLPHHRESYSVPFSRTAPDLVHSKLLAPIHYPQKVHPHQQKSPRTARAIPGGNFGNFKKLGPAGFEPATKGLCVPLRLSPPLSGSWPGPSLHDLVNAPLNLSELHETVSAVWPLHLPLGNIAVSGRLGSGLACLATRVSLPRI